MTKFALALIAALLCGGQDFDKSKHPWLKHKEGTWVKYKMSNKFGEMEPAEGSYKQTLSKIDEKEYSLTTALEMMGQNNESIDTSSIPEKDGEETVEADGKKHECVIWKSKGSRGGQEGETRMWIPKGKDFPVKFEISGQQTFKLSAAKLSDTIKTAKGELECVRLEGTVSMGGTESKASLWYSASIPGGAAKMEMEFSMGEQSGKVTIELEDYEVKK